MEVEYKWRYFTSIPGLFRRCCEVVQRRHNVTYWPWNWHSFSPCE